MGSGAKVAASNTIQLGNASIASVVTSGKIQSSGILLTSDLRLIQKSKPIENGLSTILNLNPVQLEQKSSLAPLSFTKSGNGFIAQEIQKVLPMLVTEGADKDRLLSVDYNSLIPLLTKAIQEQQAQIQQQAEDIKTLKKLIQQLLEKK